MRDYHLRVPKDLAANLRFRRAILRECKSRMSQRAVRLICERDILFFINAFVWQVNPKHVGTEIGPFITWEYQDRAILQTLERNLQDQDDMLWEKSREMGATWMALIMDVWGCLFHKWRKYLWISHSEQAVDRPADPDSLFWKVDFILKHLPSWMTAGTERRRLGFSFQNTSSSMNGAASTGRSGVGGRATRVGLDEFSKQQQASEILGQTADTGPRLFIGTHYGVGTEFYNLTQRPDMRKIVMHWTQHPEKRKGLYRYNATTNQIEVLDKTFEYPPDFKFVYSEAPLGGPFPGIRSPWYDKECVRRSNPRDIAMHLDIDPQGSQSQFFNPLTIRKLVELHSKDPVWEGELTYDHESGKPICLVEREGGLVKLWCNPKQDHRMPESLYGVGVDVSTGSGATNSVASFGNALTGEKVAEVATPHMRPEQFAPLVVALCWLFKDEEGIPAKLCWETPGPGQTFGDVVLKLGYTNIHWRQAQVSTVGTNPNARIPGWNNQNQNALNLMEHYRGSLETQAFINRSKMALEETLKYRYTPTGVEHPEKIKSNDPSGARVNHGDRVMADALCWKMMQSLQQPREVISISEALPPYGSLAWRRSKREKPQEYWA